MPNSIPLCPTLSPFILPHLGYLLHHTLLTFFLTTHSIPLFPFALSHSAHLTPSHIILLHPSLLTVPHHLPPSFYSTHTTLHHLTASTPSYSIPHHPTPSYSIPLKSAASPSPYSTLSIPLHATLCHPMSLHCTASHEVDPSMECWMPLKLLADAADVFPVRILLFPSSNSILYFSKVDC